MPISLCELQNVDIYCKFQTALMKRLVDADIFLPITNDNLYDFSPEDRWEGCPYTPQYVSYGVTNGCFLRKEGQSNPTVLIRFPFYFNRFRRCGYRPELGNLQILNFMLNSVLTFTLCTFDAFPFSSQRAQLIAKYREIIEAITRLVLKNENQPTELFEALWMVERMEDFDNTFKGVVVDPRTSVRKQFSSGSSSVEPIKSSRYTYSVYSKEESVPSRREGNNFIISYF